MNERRNDEWLDEQLRQVINTSEPQFDADTWKEKYADEYQALTARGGRGKPVPASRARMARVIRIGTVGGLTVAAAILLTIGLFFSRGRREPAGPGSTYHPVAQSPAKMVSMMSLSAAFRQGGIEALDRQLDIATEKLGPRPGGNSIAALLSDLES